MRAPRGQTFRADELLHGGLACGAADTGYNASYVRSHSRTPAQASPKFVKTGARSRMDALTDRQSEILKLIRELTEVSGFPPTRAEIAERMGFRSVNAAEQHLRALEKKGAIDISSGASRGIRVRDGRPAGRLGRLLELPVVGRVAAGSPMLAQEHIQERYQVDPN